MISTEGIFSFPTVPSRMARTLRREAGGLHPSWADEMEPVGQSYVCPLKEETLAACPLRSPGDLTVGLTQAELKLKRKLKLESSDRV